MEKQAQIKDFEKSNNKNLQKQKQQLYVIDSQEDRSIKKQNQSIYCGPVPWPEHNNGLKLASATKTFISQYTLPVACHRFPLRVL